MPTTKSKNEKTIKKVLIREEVEEGCYLVFSPFTESICATNFTGKLILELILEYNTISQVLEELPPLVGQDFNLDEIKSDIKAFIIEVEAKFDISIQHSEDEDYDRLRLDTSNSMQPELTFNVPYLESIESLFQKGEQCKTFSMPKRSCKALSSGTARIEKES